MSFKKTLLSAGIALTALAAPIFSDAFSPAQAGEEKTGFYGVLSVGVLNLDDPDWDTTVSSTAYGGSADLDSDGAAYELGIGYDFGNWRTDLTYSVSEHDLDSCTETKQSAACATGGQGSGDLNTFMANVYYDIETESKFTPYLGAGIGTTEISPDNIKVAGTEYDLKSEDTTTYQLKAGVSYEVSEKVNLLGEATYRKYDDIKTSTDVANVEFNVDEISSWSFLFGARYRF